MDEREPIGRGYSVVASLAKRLGWLRARGQDKQENLDRNAATYQATRTALAPVAMNVATSASFWSPSE